MGLLICKNWAFPLEEGLPGGMGTREFTWANFLRELGIDMDSGDQFSFSFEARSKTFWGIRKTLEIFLGSMGAQTPSKEVGLLEGPCSPTQCSILENAEEY